MTLKSFGLFVLMSICTAISLQALSQANLTIRFAYQEHNLSESAKQQIDSFLQHYKDKLITVKLVGHTNNTKGREIANQYLSLQRAKAVQTYLLSLSSKLLIDSVRGAGGSLPLTTARNKQRYLNRRVEITLVDSVDVVDNEKPTGRSLLDSLYGALATPPQVFCIDNSRDTFLVGKKGTIINIKKGDLKQSSCTCVNILLNEYFDKSDLILNNLTTTSEGKQLESGGMIKIEATCNGEVVEMADGRNISILVPTDTVLPGMKLFYGARDSVSGIVDWSGAGMDTVDFADYWRMYWHCMGLASEIEVKKCHFFFCKINRFFSGIFSRQNRKKNLTDQLNNLVTEEQRLINKYKLDTAALTNALKESKSNNKDIVKYYVFKNAGWGYRNVDRYKPGTVFKNLYVDEWPTNEIDVKFVEKNSRSVVPAFTQTDRYVFRDLFANTDGWVVVIKVHGNKIFLSLQAVNSNQRSVAPRYELVDLQQLREKVKIMDN